MSQKMIMIPFALGITQQKKLRSAVKQGVGLKLRLSAASIGAGKDIQLAVTETQARRLMKRKEAGLGADINFSATALKQSAKHGSGFFSNILRKAASAGIRGLSGLAADAIGGGFNDFSMPNNRVANMSYRRFTRPILKKQSMGLENNDFIDLPTTQGRGFFSHILKKAASAGIRGVGNLAADAIQGSGVRKPKRKVKAKRKPKTGKGLGSFFRKVAAKGVRGVGGLLADQIQGSGVRKRRPIGIYSPEFGSGIRPPGY